MSDWLSEIEDTAWREQKGDAMLMVGRMARVLRELVGILLDSFCARCDEPTRLCECRDLSDDAKELLK